jgi:hypothetical protein
MQYTSQCSRPRETRIESFGRGPPGPPNSNASPMGPKCPPGRDRRVIAAGRVEQAPEIHQLLHFIPHWVLIPLVRVRTTARTWLDQAKPIYRAKIPGVLLVRAAVPRLHRNHNQERAVKRTPRLTRLLSRPCSMHGPGA